LIPPPRRNILQRRAAHLAVSATAGATTNTAQVTKASRATGADRRSGRGRAGQWLRRATLVVAGAAALAGCGVPSHWEHPQTGQVRLAEDSAACATLARNEARRDFYYRQWYFTPLVPIHDRYGTFRYRSFDRFYFNDQYWRASELRDFCLRSRGYQLVVDAADASGAKP
jgi:hypothetical protein